MTGLATNSEYLKQADRLNKRTGEPQAFTLLRSFGKKFLESNNWPTRKDENWKYTSTQIFSTQEFTPTLLQKQILDEASKKLVLENEVFKTFPDSMKIVFINGIYEPSLSDSTDKALTKTSDSKINSYCLPDSQSKILPENPLRVINLKNAIEKGLYPIFELSKPKNSFEALNLCFLDEGVFIDVAEKTDFKPIINLVFLNTADKIQRVNLPRIVIKVGAAANITVFESYANLEESTATQWTNSQCEIHLENEAQLTWARLQNEAATQLHTCRTKIYLAESAKLHSLLLTLGANLHRHDLQIEVKGKYASAYVHGISLGTNKEHRDHNTLIDFKSGNSTAEQIFKSILHGESKSVFSGKIIIQQDSQKVDSSQLNQSLILSEKAEANSQPQLEIYADDVKATHGATIGQLNEDELFYFKSRGISETKAKLMMTQGFAIDLVERFPNEEIKKFLRQKIENKLQGFW